MTDEKKKLQLEASRNFGKSLHDLRCAGIKTVYHQDGYTDRVVLVDRETGERIGEFAAAEFLTDMTGQIFDEFVVADDYFGELVKDDSQITTTE